MINTDMSQISERTELKNTRYFQIINKYLNLALHITSGSSDFAAEHAQLAPPNPESLGQAWQIIEIDPDGRNKGMFEFVHTRSTLVLTKISGEFFLKKLLNKTEENEVRLRRGQWLKNQLFYLEQVSPEDFPNIYRFISYENRQAYLLFDKYLKVQEHDPKDQMCHWEIKPCFENPIINRSCYLENAYSSLAMDVPGGSLDSGCQLIQYRLNNRFNQRFNIYRSGEYHKISNLNSKLFLGTSKKPELGQIVRQQAKDDEMHQMWTLEYQGKNLYIFRSAINPELMIGIRDHVTKEETPLLLTKNEDFALWRIVGFIPR